MKIFSVYKATNKISGKVYIGFDSRWPRRKLVHLCSKTNTHFHNAIRKYGKDSFDWEVIYQSRDHDHTLMIMEPYFIREYNSFGENGYNMTGGGEGKLGVPSWNKGYKLSEETKSRMSLAKKGKPRSVEHNMKISISKLGHGGWKLSEETKHRMSMAKRKAHLLKMGNR